MGVIKSFFRTSAVYKNKTFRPAAMETFATSNNHHHSYADIDEDIVCGSTNQMMNDRLKELIYINDDLTTRKKGVQFGSPRRSDFVKTFKRGMLAKLSPHKKKKR